MEIGKYGKAAQWAAVLFEGNVQDKTNCFCAFFDSFIFAFGSDALDFGEKQSPYFWRVRYISELS